MPQFFVDVVQNLSLLSPAKTVQGIYNCCDVEAATEGIRMLNPVLIKECKVGRVRPGLAGLHHKGCQGTEEDIKKMQKFLRADPLSLNRLQKKCNPKFLSLVDPEFYHGFNYPLYPIHDAARMKHYECVKFLIEEGANLNKNCPTCKHGSSILNFAMSGLSANEDDQYAISLKIMKLLINNGANPNEIYENYIIPDLIYGPAERGDCVALKFLLENECVPEDLEVIPGTSNLRPLLIPTNEHVKDSKNIHGEIITDDPRVSPLASALNEGMIESYRLLLFYGATNVLYFYAGANSHDTTMAFYSIPHFFIQSFGDASRNITNEAQILYGLMVYRMFGGNMWSTMPLDANFWVTEDDPPPEVRCSETALTYLRRKPAILARFPGLEGALAEMMQRPLSLKELSRLAVRRAMGRHMWRYISQLELPEELKTFLHFPIEESLGDLNCLSLN